VDQSRDARLVIVVHVRVQQADRERLDAVGAQSSAGRLAMAIAIITRCRMAPENSYGCCCIRETGSGIPRSTTQAAVAPASVTRSSVAMPSPAPLARMAMSPPS
jgi:hypothetical protein